MKDNWSESSSTRNPLLSNRFKRDCKEQLNKLNLPEAVKNEFLDEIFGKAGYGIESMLKTSRHLLYQVHKMAFVKQRKYSVLDLNKHCVVTSYNIYIMIVLVSQKWCFQRPTIAYHA